MNIIFIIIISILIVLCAINYILQSPSRDNKNNIINILIRQIARWAIAAEQDQNIMIAVLHANYAAGYLWALQSIASDSEIKSASGINFKLFENEITRIQDNATRKMASMCPNIAPTNKYLFHLADN
jgi:hypothetical protein